MKNMPSSVDSKSPTKGFIINNLAIQVGAFGNKDNAIALSKKYTNKNYEAKLYPFTNNEGKTIYRVKIIGFRSYKEIDDYKERYNLSNVVIVGVKWVK